MPAMDMVSSNHGGLNSIVHRDDGKRAIVYVHLLLLFSLCPYLFLRHELGGAIGP